MCNCLIFDVLSKKQIFSNFFNAKGEICRQFWRYAETFGRYTEKDSLYFSKERGDMYITPLHDKMLFEKSEHIFLRNGSKNAKIRGCCAVVI